MAERSSANSGLARLAGSLLFRYIWAVQKTSTWVPHLSEIEGRRQARKITSNHPFIFAMWHGQFLLSPLLYLPDCPTEVMVARHGDAAIVSALLAHFDMKLIRGAGAGGRKKDRGGTHAIRAAQEALRNGTSVAMTADVPPGPARRAGMGIVTLARITGRPIVPVAIASSRYMALNTWSKMTLNLPFSRCGSAVADAIHVPRDIDAAEEERLRQLVESRLNEATREAYAKAGAEDPILARSRATGYSRGGLALPFYRTVTKALAPAAPALLRYRAGRGKEDPARRNERIGQASRPRPEGALAWVHAGSKAEVGSAADLVSALKQRRPDLSVLLTAGSVAAARSAAARLGDAVIHQLAPLDSPVYVRCFLDHWVPELGVFAGSAIWPNLILEAAERNIPLVLANARMSDRTFRGWQRHGAMAHSLFSRFSVVLAQNDMLVRRFTRLGARDVRAAGNLRFDAPVPLLEVTERQPLVAALAGRPVLLAAQIHAGEEAMVAEACRRLARSKPGLMTVIVPRHADRGPAITASLQHMGIKVAQHCLGEVPGPGHEAYIAEPADLGLLYSLSSVAFIGGSTVAHGGQSPIEAARRGSAVLAGPNVKNFRDAYKELMRRKGARQVSSAEELIKTVEELAENSKQLEAMRVNARDAMHSLSGALARTLDALEGYLPEQVGQPVRKAS